MGKRDRVYSVDFEGNGTSNGDQMLSVNCENNENTSNGDQEEITLIKKVPCDKDVSQTMKTRNEQRKQRCEILVDFIKSEKMKKYLTEIFHGKRASALHSSYHGSVRDKNKIKNPGFGPISDEEQRSEVLDTLLSWLGELRESVAENVDYTMDVWVPEAIVYALISVKKYSRGRAWDMFHKGIRFTKEEYGKAHQAILEAANRISPEDKEMYESKLQEKIAMWTP
ncbi:uncharacterized protein LOC135472869 [Liolophura sinensis]|uniref:uncharacterized protein LOC135472869 n=1 Tax=Liolophura sinensis TaxID=3198878 RepID=UPI0031584496